MALVICAHPDDELLGCGGTLLKWKDSGFPPTIVFAGTGRVGGSQSADALVVAAKAGWTIGAWGPFPDTQFGPLEAVVGWVEGILEKYGGPRILIHSGHEMNQDHQILHDACKIACRPWAGKWKAGLGPSRELWSFEIPGSTGSGFIPNLYFDTSGHWKRKGGLVELYRSEHRLSPHPRSPEALEARARLRGSEAGVPMAEAFHLEFQLIGQTSGTAS